MERGEDLEKWVLVFTVMNLASSLTKSSIHQRCSTSEFSYVFPRFHTTMSYTFIPSHNRFLRVYQEHASPAASPAARSPKINHDQSATLG